MRAEGLAVVVVDLAVAATAPAAAQRLLTAVHRELGQRWKDLATGLLGRLRPGTFSLQGGVDTQGKPTLTFQVAPATDSRDALVITDVLDAVEQELAARNITLGLGLDEFQRLGRWYGADIAWQLKEMLERHRRIAYVLAGSERTLVEQMLQDRKAGLWKVVDVLDMQPVPENEMAPWIVKRAHETGVALTLATATHLIELAGPRTRDIVQLARATWDAAQSGGSADMAAPDRALYDLVIEQGALHQRQWDQLPDNARSALIALAMEPDVQLLAAATLKRYALGPKSTVSDVLDDLCEREILFRRTSSVTTFEFDDPFFRYWIRVSTSAG